jgi:hypothetical protein
MLLLLLLVVLPLKPVRSIIPTTTPLPLLLLLVLVVLSRPRILGTSCPRHTNSNSTHLLPRIAAFPSASCCC